MKLTFDGQELEVKSLDLNQLIEIEDKFGSLAKIENNIPLKMVRFIAYLAVKAVIPNVTEEQVGKNLSLASMQEIPKLLSPEAHVSAERPLAQA